MRPVFRDDFERRDPARGTEDEGARLHQVEGLLAQVQEDGDDEWPPEWLREEITELLNQRGPDRDSTDGEPAPVAIELTPDARRLVASRMLVVARDQELFGEAEGMLAGLGFDPVPDEDRCRELDPAVAVFRAKVGTKYDAVTAALGALRERLPEVKARDVSVGVMHTVIKSGDRPVATTVPVGGGTGLGGALADPPAHPPVVAVIDTGLTEQLRSDQLLNEIGRVAGLDGNVDELDVLPHDDVLDFGAGHGTFVAGIVRQVSADCTIRTYRALDTQGFGTEVAVACAIVRAVAEGADVVCLSLGMQHPEGNPLAFEAALDWIDEHYPKRRRPVVVAAAGNYGTTTEVWPAASPRVLAVAALRVPQGEEAGPQPAAWSSSGCWVDCSTMGEGIVSTFVELPDTELDPWALWSGTSFAAPQLAGAIARVMIEEDGLTAAQARDRLVGPAAERPDDGFGKRLMILPGT